MSPVLSCFACEGPMEIVREREQFKLGRRRATVDVERFRCGQCGEVFYSPDQADAAQVAVADQIRSQDGALSPSAIKDIRRRLCLTQVQLEQLLGVGPKSVVRWERGTVTPNRATDQLLRLVRDVPEAFAYMAALNHVTLGEPSYQPASLSGSLVRVATGETASNGRKVLPFSTPFQTQGTEIDVSSDETPVSTIPKEALK